MGLRSLLLAALLCAGVAHADENLKLGEAHFRTGVAYFEQGQYEQALSQFKEAEKFTPRPELDYNIARCYERIGDAARAVAYYHKYLQARPNADDRQETEDALERLMHRVGTLKVAAPPAGVTLRLDGEALAVPADGLVTVTVGAHQVAATRPGYLPRQVPVEVHAGETVEVDATPTVEEPRAGPVSERRRWKLWLGVGVGAAVVAAVAIGVGVGVGASGGRDFWSQARGCEPNCQVLDLR